MWNGDGTRAIRKGEEKKSVEESTLLEHKCSDPSPSSWEHAQRETTSDVIIFAVSLESEIIFTNNKTSIMVDTTIPDQPAEHVGDHVARVVTFNRNVGVRNHIHHHDYTDIEYHDTFSNHEDMDHYQADLRLTVVLMEKGELHHDTVDFCTRGLEYRTKKGMRARLENRIRARNLVLDLQEAQWNAHVHDDEEIAIAYQRETEHCALEARHLGMEDEIHMQDTLLPSDSCHCCRVPPEKIECPKTGIVNFRRSICRVVLGNAAA
eukprot:Nitzschia sp. Nitz4//scaffold8_size234185//226408//227199//NITZ4_001307-RA/size234185-processed-gene-0.179-mRNA-1//-1//CDS//3329559956//1599//frame0